jgi:hypothetical protein
MPLWFIKLLQKHFHFLQGVYKTYIILLAKFNFFNVKIYFRT